LIRYSGQYRKEPVSAEHRHPRAGGNLIQSRVSRFAIGHCLTLRQSSEWQCGTQSDNVGAEGNNAIRVW